MRLSLWQQFSSNHSASFTVVGRFATETSAEEAEKLVRELLIRIRDFRTQHGLALIEEYSPTPPEVEASTQYGIAWDKSIEWIQLEISEHVMRYENYVFVSTAYASTYQCPETIEPLINKLAEQTYVQSDECFPAMVILVELRCDIPGVSTATRLQQELQSYFNSLSGRPIAPWEIYSDKINLGYTILNKPYNRELNQQVIRNVVDALYQYQRAVEQDTNVSQAEMVAINALNSLTSEGYRFSEVITVEMLPSIVSLELMHDADALGGKFQIRDGELHMSEVAFYDLKYGLPALIAYLRASGGSHIRYSLQSVPYDSRPEYQ